MVKHDMKAPYSMTNLFFFLFFFCCPCIAMSSCFREKEREGIIETILPITTKPDFLKMFFLLFNCLPFVLPYKCDSVAYQNLRNWNWLISISPWTSLLKSGKLNFVTRPIPSGPFSKMRVCLSECQSLESRCYHHDHQWKFTLIMHFCNQALLGAHPWMKFNGCYLGICSQVCMPYEITWLTEIEPCGSSSLSPLSSIDLA